MAVDMIAINFDRISMAFSIAVDRISTVVYVPIGSRGFLKRALKHKKNPEV